MPRQRLGVVLLVPQPLATRIDGLRGALGDGALGRIAPHITLVPPVNVAERDLPAAFATVRGAAASSHQITLRIGPVATFAPVNPVAYLEVGGDPEARAELDHLRDACLVGPLHRSTDHEFVPHVTVADDLADDRLGGAPHVLRDFEAEATFELLHVLAEQPGRVWQPVADAPLGARPGHVGRGSLPLEITVSGRPDAEAAALLAIEGEPGGLPFAVTARRDGTVIAAGWGWSAQGVLEVADLAVAAAHRNAGVGRHLLATIEAVARRRGCALVGLTAPDGGAAAALLEATGFGFTSDASSAAPGRRRWVRMLQTTEADATGGDR